MKRIFFEYAAKSTPPYETLLRYGGSHFALIEPSPDELARITGIECDDIAFAGEKLLLLPNRRSGISVGAFLGGQREIWESVARQNPPPYSLSKRVFPAHNALTTLIANPHMSYFCSHVETGALQYESLLCTPHGGREPYNGGPTTHTHRAHIVLGAKNLPIIIGGRARWYCSFANPEDSTDLNEAATKLGTMIGWHLKSREKRFAEMDAELATRLMATDPSIHVDIYLPSEMMDPKSRLDLIDQMESLRHVLAKRTPIPMARWSKDVFKLHDVKDAPACEACGWCVDDL